MRFRSLAILALASSSVVMAEDDFGVLHITNANLELSGRSTLQIHTRVRTYENSTRFFQFRAGPILIHRFTPRVVGLAGYYYINQDGSSPQNRQAHRYWAGPQFRILDYGRWAIDTRHLAERFAVVDGKDQARYRNRAMLIYKSGTLQPFASFEALVQNGVWYERHAAGLQINSRGALSYAISYEYRASPIGPGIHLIATTIQFRAWRQGPPHID